MWILKLLALPLMIVWRATNILLDGAREATLTLWCACVHEDIEPISNGYRCETCGRTYTDDAGP